MATAASSDIWTAEVELALFMAMVGLRPVGIHRHFRLVNIYTRLVGRIGSVGLGIGDMKARLDTMYNMQLLDEIEAEEGEDDDDETGSNGFGMSAPARKIGGRSRYDGGKKTPSEAGTVHADDDDRDGNSSSGDVPGRSAKAHMPSRKRIGGDRPEEVAYGVPATSSIAGVLDASDPQFWRRSDAEFALPWAEFGTLMVERAGAGVGDEDLEASIASASPGSTPKEVTREPSLEPTPEPVSSDGRASPVQKRRRGRSATPVPRSRVKAPAATPVPTATRSTAQSARKKARPR
ncbi:hypothetical protein H4R26_002186 [Coemansia thaxteri]|uniref:Uncharacterized protein n=1 Tax=Coemansia thaxteri TaxID=2663907 RepID=A0A9W8BES9_9FUNG|nr:hypothetical protein H4R26_002186 [Coemansia thaxteri]KAJ2485391.1 hypothetical protein EV174_001773 [Coemansia sp. RSA 2320]